MFFFFLKKAVQKPPYRLLILNYRNLTKFFPLTLNLDFLEVFALYSLKYELYISLGTKKAPTRSLVPTE